MIRVTLVLVAAHLVIPRLRSRSAAERHLLWTLALAGATSLPLLAWVVPSWVRRAGAVLPSAIDAFRDWSPSSGTDIVVRAVGIESGGGLLAISLMTLWGVGTALMLLALARDMIKVVRLTASARPVRDPAMVQMAADTADRLTLACRPRLLISNDTAIPLAWGHLRGRVLLPQAAHEWPAGRLRAVLAHEFAHLRRGDWPVHVVAELLCAVYWFHPLVWLAHRQLRSESERAADDLVLGLGVDAHEYATHLLDIVRAVHRRARVWTPTVAMARTSHLEQRVAALLDVCVNRRRVSRTAGIGTTTIALATALFLATVSAREAAANISIRTSNVPAIRASMAAGGSQRAGAAPRLQLAAAARASSDVMTPPEIAEYTTPALYSEAARARGVEGLVTVGVHIGADGRIGDVHIVHGLGFGLDQNALVAVRQWRFRPGTRNGEPVAMDAEVTIEFSLRNEAINELIANDMAVQVGPGITPPRAVRVVQPRPGARGAGTVVLDIVLLENGTPKIVRILQSVTPELDRVAIQAFEQWRFSPAIQDGRPVKIRMNAEVNFRGSDPKLRDH